jgi:hypothetical protein
MDDRTSQLLALAVHELRNPVSVILGYLRMLSEERAGPLSPRQREMVGDLSSSAQELAQLLKDLSELANIESQSVVFVQQELSVQDLVEPVAGQMTGVGVTPALSGTTAGQQLVTGDTTRLRAALGAILATLRVNIGPDETICIRPGLRRSGGRHRIRLTAGTAATVKRLAAAPPDRLERFFVAGGRGSLASLVGCGVIAAHGGAVWMGRRQRRPQNAVIELPLTEPRAAAARPAQTTPGRARRQ